MSKGKRFIYSGLLSILLPAAILVSQAHSAPKQEPKSSEPLPLPPPDYVYETGNKRDPFIPLITSDGRFVPLEKTPGEESESVLKVEGIIYDKFGLSYAIVDGSVVKIGDLISDYQVLAIEEKKVIFIREGQLKEVPLKKEE
ncbi:MAG TPA: hypothetical protein PLJ26_01915 [Candidatus Omnitrophota bacterium]|nr:hypothetical protein [Candidatus Omnitrophota bacterium]HQJ15228.1 hypothetical protein [Candidatus Omnitrophota bacterium]